METRVLEWQDDAYFRSLITPIVAAATLHVIIYAALFIAPQIKVLPRIDTAISIQIIESRPTSSIPATQADVKPIDAPPTVTPAPPLNPPPESLPTPTPPAPQSETPQRPASPTAPTAISPHIIAGPVHDGDDEEDNVPSAYIPSRWALEPALSQNRLEGIFGDGFEKDIKCIRSLSEDCNNLRTTVFAQYQLTQQDLIWTESSAHNGLTNPELHGLSEREIRNRLAIPIAGDNAFVILPGIAIDGNLWDSLHGVNKKCPVFRGVRRCPDLAPKADDKRFHIPKKE